MAKKTTTKLRPWTKENLRTLKTLARERTKTTVIARKLSVRLKTCGVIGIICVSKEVV
jgi:hypothetical protein